MMCMLEHLAISHKSLFLHSRKTDLSTKVSAVAKTMGSQMDKGFL